MSPLNLPDSPTVQEVRVVEHQRLSPVVGIPLRSLGWVAFGLIMVTSFAAIVNVPRGVANADKSHPVALVIAVMSCIGCWALRRWARLTRRVSWLFRPATLRVLALVLVVGIMAFANWQGKRICLPPGTSLGSRSTDGLGRRDREEVPLPSVKIRPYPRPMRRTLLWLLAVSLVLLVLAVIKVEHDRHTCPAGPWAHPIDRLQGGRHEYNVVCVE